MKTSGGGIEVRGTNDLLREFEGLLSDPAKRRGAGEKAYGVAVLDGSVLQRSLDLLARYVDFQSASRVAAR